MSVPLTIELRGPDLETCQDKAMELARTFFGGRDVRLALTEATTDDFTLWGKVEFRCTFEAEAR